MAVHEYPQSHGSLAGLSDTDHHKQYQLYTEGTAAARPTGPWRKGRWYYATDTGDVSFDNGGGWVTVPMTKAQLDAMNINAATLQGYAANEFMPGWSSSGVHRAYELVLFNGAETAWRRLCTVTFNAVADGVASYTGATFEAEIANHWQSWGQTNGNPTVSQQIKITNSNTFTTSNARTAQISGSWYGYDFLRVVRVSDWVWEIQGRSALQYGATVLRLKQIANSGVTSTTYALSSDGGPPGTPMTGTTETLFSNGSTHQDSRGWQNVNSLGFMAGWSQYAGQTSLGQDWCARYRRIGSVVYMEGLITSNAAGNHAFTLPAAFRPANGNAMRSAENSSGGQARMDIYPSGQVHMMSVGTIGWANIGCNFIAEQ